MIWFVALFLAVGTFGLGAIFGAPYLPILGRDAEALLDLADLEPGQSIIDLGSGDGALLLAAAKRGIRGIGYEINPLLYGYSRLRLWRYRELIKIHLADFWRADWPESDAIYVFLIGHYMAKLDRYLSRKIKRPTRVISYVFVIPGKDPVSQTNNSYCYLYGQGSHSRTVKNIKS